MVLAMLALVPSSVSAESLDPEILSIMTDVLAGDVEKASRTAKQIADSGSGRLMGQLAIELSDLAAGNYATRGNRSFIDLKAYWAAARARWIRARYPSNAAALPTAVLALAPEVDVVLLADASQSIGWLMQRTSQDDWRIADAFYLSLGAGGIGKVRRGDRKTPLGVYWVVEELDSLRLPKRYGVRIFPLDYPNALDRAQSRTGDGIWIHGMDPDNNIRPPNDTDGCIALVNERILTLGESLQPATTPVVVVESLEWGVRPQPDAVLNELERSLDAWRRALISGNPDSYFSVFADDYARFDMPASLWRAGRRAALLANIVSDIEISELSVLVADSDELVYVTRFRQTIAREAGKAPVSVIRRFYWQADDDGKFRIIAEQNG